MSNRVNKWSAKRDNKTAFIFLLGFMYVIGLFLKITSYSRINL